MHKEIPNVQLDKIRAIAIENQTRYIVEYYYLGEWCTCMLNSMYPVTFSTAAAAIQYASDILKAVEK